MNDPLENDLVETILLAASLLGRALYVHLTSQAKQSKAMTIIISPTGNLIHHTEWCFSKDLTSALESPNLSPNWPQTTAQPTR
jgi:hypothetical protein